MVIGMNITAAERSYAVAHITGNECPARPVVRMLAALTARAGEDSGDFGYKSGNNRNNAPARSRSALRG